MARLILLNGAPGTGKSTLARRYVEDRPLSLALDIDTVRAMLGGWAAQPIEAGLAARALAVEMARVHLTAGHDVIVPQYLGRIEFVLQLERLCDETGARFVELALLADADSVVRRFARRAAAPTTAEHRDAATLQASPDAVDLADTVARIDLILRQRPRNRTVHGIDGDIESTYRLLLTELDRWC